MPSAADDNYACRIVRSDRPCLVCPGKMDLVEAHPRYSLFSGLPLCSSESIDCLDCPKCGFTTSTTDYQYLQICKIQRQGMFQTRSSRRDRKNSSSRREKICSNCKANLSSKWQFCPGCGSKCGGSTTKTSFKVPAVVMGTSTESTLQQAAATATNTASVNSASTDSASTASRDTGIVRMVTPPKRLATQMDTEMTNASQVSV